jgi:transforming growth factor-beta-induced protein
MMFRIGSLFLASIAVPAFAALGTRTSRQLQPTTVVDLAVTTPSLSTLVTAVTTAELATALSNPDATFTVFAPDNDAFGTLPEGLLDALLTLGFKAHLTAILLYHVFADAAVLSSALAATQDITMLNGEVLTVAASDTGVTVTTTAGQTATVTTADVEGSNGVVHIIDGVLVPSSIGATVIDLASDYSTLLSLIAVAGLEEALAGGPFTLFAPTNTALAVLDATVVEFLTSAAGAANLADILTYHVVSGSVTSDLVVDGAMAPTLQGSTITFSVGDTVMVNDATVVMADMLAFNGVTHGIDKLLVPFADTIADIAVDTPSLSTLVVAAVTVGPPTALTDPAATTTAFPPSNDAFGALPDGLLDTLLTPGFKAHLTEILLYHIFADAIVLSSALAATQDITMLNGEVLTVAASDTGVTVTTTAGQTATVIMADLQGSNGVMHIIDGVLVPSSIGASVIDLGSDYSTLLSLVTRAGLEETLMGGPFTLFAPTDTAFGALAPETVTLLTSDEGAAMLASILTYHVVSGSVTSDMVMNDMSVATVQGAEITFTVDMGSVMVNDATVVMADMLAFNGVTHGIDKILMPPADAASMAPTMAPTMAPDSGSLAVGASLSAVFAAVMAVAL